MDGIEGVDVVFRCQSVERAKEIMLAIGDGCILDEASVRLVVLDDGIMNAPAVAAITRMATQHAIGLIDQLAEVR